MRLYQRQRNSLRPPGTVRERLDGDGAQLPPDDTLDLPRMRADLVGRGAGSTVYTPERDERLTGEGGAELGARQLYPVMREDAIRRVQEQAAAAVQAGAERAGMLPGGGEPLGGEDLGAAAATSAPDYSRRRAYQDLLAGDAEDTNGRGRSAARMGLHSAARAAESGSVGYTLGAGIGGAVRGLFDKDSDEEEIDRPRDLARAKSAADAEAAEEEQTRKREAHAADVDYKNSQAEWNRRRPELAQEKTLRESVKYDIANRLKDPRPFDPNDEYDADLLMRSRSLGINFSPGSFGDHKNPFTIEIHDPTDPTNIKKTRMSFDRTTRTWSPVTDAGGAPVVTSRVQPVGDDGRTPTQRDANADRDEARENTERHRAAMLALSTDRLQVQMTNGLNASAKRIFDTRTKGLFEQRRQLETQINGLRTRSAKRELPPADAERRINELQQRLDGLTSQIDGARSEALGSMSAAPQSLPVFRGVGAGAGKGGAPAASGKKYTEAEIRQWARDGGRDADAAVRSARAKGILK